MTVESAFVLTVSGALQVYCIIVIKIYEQMAVWLNIRTSKCQVGGCQELQRINCTHNQH